MNSRKCFFRALICSMGLLLPGIVTAIPVTLTVDFRDASWSGADGTTPFTVGTVTASASTGTLFQDSIDGLGITSGSFEADEVELTEILSVTFGGGGMLLGRIWITDLFEAPDGGVGEHGAVLLNGTTLVSFGPGTAPQSDPAGEFLVDLGGNMLITSADFYVDNTVPGIDPDNNEFSVAGFDVPEPGMLALFGISLLGLGLTRRIRQ